MFKKHVQVVGHCSSFAHPLLEALSEPRETAEDQRECECVHTILDPGTVLSAAKKVHALGARGTCDDCLNPLARGRLTKLAMHTEKTSVNHF